MDTSQQPFDISYSFDAQLHEQPNNPAEMRQAVDWLIAELDAEPELRGKAQIAGMAGSYARIIRELDVAQRLLEQALGYARQLGDVRLEIANQLRLAHVHQWRGDYATSTPLFAATLQRCQQEVELRDYLDFAHQHAGKNAFDQGFYAQAEEHFQAALELRRQHGAPSLIESTELALETVQRKLGLE